VRERRRRRGWDDKESRRRRILLGEHKMLKFLLGKICQVFLNKFLQV